MTISGSVSPLEAIDLIYASPWPEDPELRALLALLARHWPSIWPSRERIALGIGLKGVGSVSRRLRRLEDEHGLITSITLGARANQRTFRILHLPELPLVIPPELRRDTQKRTSCSGSTPWPTPTLRGPALRVGSS